MNFVCPRYVISSRSALNSCHRPSSSSPFFSYRPSIYILPLGRESKTTDKIKVVYILIFATDTCCLKTASP